GDRVDGSGDHPEEGDDAEPDGGKCDREDEDPHSEDHSPEADDDATTAACPAALVGECPREARVVGEELSLHLIEHLLLVLRQRHGPAPCPDPGTPGWGASAAQLVLGCLHRRSPHSSRPGGGWEPA